MRCNPLCLVFLWWGCLSFWSSGVLFLAVNNVTLINQFWNCPVSSQKRGWKDKQLGKLNFWVGFFQPLYNLSMEFLLFFFSAFTSPTIRDSKMKRAADVYFLHRAPVTQSFFWGWGRLHPGCWKNSLASCSCRLVIHPRAACRGWEQAEEILPPVSRYVWSAHSWGLPADTARPASPLLIWDRNGHLPCLEESLSLPPGAQGLHPCVHVSVCPCSAARLWLQQSLWAPHVSAALVGNTLSHRETLFLDAKQFWLVVLI